MVGIGEYSPNYRGNRPVLVGASCGIFGEYEERRKYYNEQRKLEYHQYLAQKNLSVTRRNETNIPSLSSSRTPCVNFSPADATTSCVQKEVATQTADREFRDASTNTDLRSYLNEVDGSCAVSSDTKHNAGLESSSVLKEKDGISSGQDMWDKSHERSHAENHRVEHDDREGFSSLLKESGDQNHRRQRSIGVSCVRSLWDKSSDRGLAKKFTFKEQDKSQDIWWAKESRSRSERCSREGKNFQPVENSSTTSVLSHLGEVRRRLAMKQVEMEEALRKNKLNNE